VENGVRQAFCSKDGRRAANKIVDREPDRRWQSWVWMGERRKTSGSEENMNKLARFLVVLAAAGLLLVTWAQPAVAR
jgi:hypothetical protein